MQSTNIQPNTKRITNDARTVGALTTHGRGIVKGNPQRCLKCHNLIRAGEAWTKHTSAPDPDLEFGRYSFIVHARCEGHNR